jgi:hypothetical protein
MRPTANHLASLMGWMNSRYPADTLPSDARMASLESRAKCVIGRRTTKSTKARTLGTYSWPCGAMFSRSYITDMGRMPLLSARERRSAFRPHLLQSCRSASAPTLPFKTS